MASRKEFKIDLIGGSGHAKMMSLNWGVTVLEVKIAVLEKVLLGHPETSFFVDSLVLTYPICLKKMKTQGRLEVSFLACTSENSQLLHPQELLRHSRMIPVTNEWFAHFWPF